MAKPNITAVPYRTRTVCNTVKKTTTGITIGGAPVPQGLGVTFCGTVTIDGKLTVADRKNAFARTANQRSWWWYWPRRTGSERRNNRNNESFSRCWPLRFDTITMSRQRFENITKFGLLGQRFNTMEKQGCVKTTYTDNDFNNTRKDWRWWALKKANCSFWKKRLVSLWEKRIFSLWEKRIVSLWEKRDGSFSKKRFFRLQKGSFVALKKADFSFFER